MPRRIHDRHTDKVIFLTEHARKRAEQMHAGPALIAQAALLPDVSYRGSGGDDTRIQRCDGSPIAVVFNPDTNTVITVLWNTVDTYVRPDKKESA